MNVREAYLLLGIDYGLSLVEIEPAFRKLILVWHPDRFVNNDDLHSQAEDKCKALNEARDVLREAWSSGCLKDLESRVNSSNVVKSYEDQAVQYLGHDPRMRPLTILERRGRCAVTSVSKDGLILVTAAGSAADETARYPAKTIRAIAAMEGRFVRSSDISVSGAALPVNTDIVITVDDQDGVVSGFHLNLRFRSEYHAKLFLNKAVTSFGLQEYKQRLPKRDKKIPLAPGAAEVLLALLVSLIFVIFFVAIVVAFSSR